MTTWIVDPVYVPDQQVVDDLFFDDWTVIVDLLMQYPERRYRTDLLDTEDCVFWDAATMVESQHQAGDLPYGEENHRCVLVAKSSSQIAQYGGDLVFLWSRKTHSADAPLSDVSRLQSMWRTSLAWSEKVFDYEDGWSTQFHQANYIKLSVLPKAFSPFGVALSSYESPSDPLPYGDRSYVLRHYVLQQPGPIDLLSRIVAEEYLEDPPATGYIEEIDRLPMTGVEFMPLESEDLSRIADLIERLLQQPITISLNNGRIVVQWPAGEVSEGTSP